MAQQPSSPYALPRDRATDRSNLVDLQTIGLAARDPQTGLLVPVDPAWNMGRQVGVDDGLDGKTGRPDGARQDPIVVQARDPDAAPPVAFAPGSIRRNVTWPAEGNGGKGQFSWASNQASDPGAPFQVTGVAEYVISSLHLQLSRALSWVVAGVKPAIPAGPAGQHGTGQVLRAATGWPVVAPQVPSYSARVPLLRPRDLVSQS